MGLAKPLRRRCWMLPREEDGGLTRGSRPTQQSPIPASGQCKQDRWKGGCLPTWHYLHGAWGQGDGRGDLGWSPSSPIDPPRPMQTPDPPLLSLIVGGIHQQLGLCYTSPKDGGLHCPRGSCSEGTGLRSGGATAPLHPSISPSIALLLVCPRGYYLGQCPHRAGPG